MKRVFIFIAAFLLVNTSIAQIRIRNKKYPGLLWEISGNQLKKPSYLFGTMHVSSKIVFNLADSFYLGIRNADIVALETNPESWQEDMSKYDISTSYSPGFHQPEGLPNDFLSIHTLEFNNYEKGIEQALYTNPSVINNLLYRTYGEYAADFEENTYLDMYIYQVGKKWGKRLAGVENYGESMKLMMEAYKDAAADKNRKERSFDPDNGFSAEKLQEAYRSGNLDLLDSLNRLQSISDAFDEKFLYRRNEIQARSIDSILKSGLVLFVGVGAAHLPGTRGVIELLREKGYHLRPVFTEKKNDGKQKEAVEKIHVPVIFTTRTADDQFFKVDVPGRLYRSDDRYQMTDQQQYADMANGSYYIVTRLRTNNVMWGNSAGEIFKKIDSVLYENIPGKIVSKKVIFKNGYKGFDIVNKTRRGDFQRYNIFVTPFEVIFFKMSGNEDYVISGPEGNQFFNSIRLKEFDTRSPWQEYSPPFGGFAVSLPHAAFISNDGSWLFDAEDKADQSSYRVVRSDIHNFHFTEVDSFDLALMEESFRSSPFIGKETDRRYTRVNGYPALDCRFSSRDSCLFLVRFIIQGPHEYSVIARGKAVTPKMSRFIESFAITPFRYNASRWRRDSSLYFTVESPVFPEAAKEKISFAGPGDLDGMEASENSEEDQLVKGVYRNKVISDDSTGQKIFISYYKPGRYRYEKDSLRYAHKDFRSYLGGDSAWVLRDLKKREWPGHIKTWEYYLYGKGSSRVFRKKDFQKKGANYSIVMETDSLTAPDAFSRSFFDSFSPADSTGGPGIFEKKSFYFFSDFFSKDSAIHQRAINNIPDWEAENADLPQLKKAIQSLNWQQKKYLGTRKALIYKLKSMDSKESVLYLSEIYREAGDTVELQDMALQALVLQQTAYSMQAFGDIIAKEPPVLPVASNGGWDESFSVRLPAIFSRYHLPGANFLDGLYDSLALSKTILPQLLPLLDLEDYKWPVMRLLAKMTEEQLLKPKEYRNYASRLLLEANLELRKQAISEKRKAIRKAEELRSGTKLPSVNAFENLSDLKDYSSDELEVYATLLLPFESGKTEVANFFKQLLHSPVDRVRYNSMALLLRNNRPVPDSLPEYFASLDEYRYRLYADLKDMEKSAIFPAPYNNHLALAYSKLLGLKTYERPDSIIFQDSLIASYGEQCGHIYFFRYKQKKDDDSWKLAYVGLVPQDEFLFEFDDIINEQGEAVLNLSDGFTGFGDIRLKDDEPVNDQLKEVLRRLIYSQHRSAKEFYDSREIDPDLAAVKRY